MDSFFVIKNNDDTYRIECKLIVYRALHGKHPDFLKPEGDEQMGFNTKYFLLIKDDISNESEANLLAHELNTKYQTLITVCEDSGNWDNFPFKHCPIIYYK